MNRFARLARRLPAALAAPLLGAYLYVGSCGSGQHGFVLDARAWSITLTIHWCSPD